MQETQVQSLSREDPLERGLGTHSVLLPGEFHGQRSLAGHSLWGHKESDMTEQLTLFRGFYWPQNLTLWIRLNVKAIAIDWYLPKICSLLGAWQPPHHHKGRHHHSLSQDGTLQNRKLNTQLISRKSWGLNSSQPDLRVHSLCILPCCLRAVKNSSGWLPSWKIWGINK